MLVKDLFRARRRYLKTAWMALIERTNLGAQLRAAVDNRTRESVAAIDGLYAWQGELIGVQNVTNPGRVIRMQLSADGDSVIAVKTLLSHHHAYCLDGSPAQATSNP